MTSFQDGTSVFGQMIKPQRFFTNHLRRRSLLKTWRTVKLLLYKKIPIWLSLLEAISRQNSLLTSKPLTYADLLEKDEQLKSLQQLKQEELEISWWQYNQLS